jgi:hypothetical protein
MDTPALYVLAPGGHLIKVKDTSELERRPEQGEGYDQAQLQAFLFQYEHDDERLMAW